MPERTIETEIAVVGAGIAGLSAAWTLANQGVDVVVLEARDRVGGREWNVEIGGEANELGGQWVAPYQSAMHALLEELEIEFPSFREGEHVWENDHGHDGVREWMEEMKRDWTTFEVRPERYLDVGGDRVLAIGSWRAQWRGGGVPLDFPQASWLTQWRRGKLILLQTFTDRNEALEAAGLEE